MFSVPISAESCRNQNLHCCGTRGPLL